MSLSAETIARASSLQEASRHLTNHVLNVTASNWALRVTAASMLRWKRAPSISGGAAAAPKICPICEGPILAEDLVVSARARPTVHLLCWSATRTAAASASVAPALSAGGAAKTTKNPDVTARRRAE